MQRHPQTLTLDRLHGLHPQGDLQHRAQGDERLLVTGGPEGCPPRWRRPAGGPAPPSGARPARRRPGGRPRRGRAPGPAPRRAAGTPRRRPARRPLRPTPRSRGRRRRPGRRRPAVRAAACGHPVGTARTSPDLGVDETPRGRRRLVAFPRRWPHRPAGGTLTQCQTAAVTTPPPYAPAPGPLRRRPPTAARGRSGLLAARRSRSGSGTTSATTSPSRPSAPSCAGRSTAA